MARYMEVHASYPVGIILKMKLEANGVPVEAMGVVRVNYPYLGTGIAFGEMPEATAARLRELLNQVSRPTVGTAHGMSSSLGSGGTLGLLAQVVDPISALRALAQFFENRQTLMRHDFLRSSARAKTRARR